MSMSMGERERNMWRRRCRVLPHQLRLYSKLSRDQGVGGESFGRVSTPSHLKGAHKKERDGRIWHPGPLHVPCPLGRDLPQRLFHLKRKWKLDPIALSVFHPSLKAKPWPNKDKCQTKRLKKTKQNNRRNLKRHIDWVQHTYVSPCALIAALGDRYFHPHFSGRET